MAMSRHGVLQATLMVARQLHWRKQQAQGWSFPIILTCLSSTLPIPTNSSLVATVWLKTTEFYNLGKAGTPRDWSQNSAKEAINGNREAIPNRVT